MTSLGDGVGDPVGVGAIVGVEAGVGSGVGSGVRDGEGEGSGGPPVLAHPVIAIVETKPTYRLRLMINDPIYEAITLPD